jgi:Motility related/secretion protein
MFKRIAFLLIISIMIISLTAEVFTPHFTIPGFTPLKNNQLDYFKLRRGYSISPYAKHKLGTYKITTEKEIDFDEQRVTLVPKLGSIILGNTYYMSLESFNNSNFSAYFHQTIDENAREVLNTEDRTDDAGLIPEIVIDLPKIALPKAVRKFMGNKAGRLSLDGTQRLTISGRDTFQDEEGDENDREQNFDFVIQQDLNLRLRGTIGEKIHVDVNHRQTSDDNAIPEPTTVKINYEGDEDEIVKSIEGGNISLSLSSARFISYSVSSEGLFGIKTELEAGNLHVTTIMGKDEAQKNTREWKGDSAIQKKYIHNNSFEKREMYFIDLPELLYQLYDGSESVVYPGYIDNAVKLSSSGAWQMSALSQNILPDPNSELVIYLDDNNGSNNISTVAGIEEETTDTYDFNILNEGTDYYVDYLTGIITFFPQNFEEINTYSIQDIYTIGIAYTQQGGTIVGDNNSSPREVKILKRDSMQPEDEEWNFQVMNIYDLGFQNISSDGFHLEVYSEDEVGAEYLYVPTEIGDPNLTLDDYLRLDTNGVDGITGDDATINLEGGYVIFPFIRPFEELNAAEIYQSFTPNVSDYEDYTIYVEGQIGYDQISLNQEILPGSVTIKLNGSTLTENIDYIVDYTFGDITFLTEEAKSPTADIKVSYQFRPLFSVESKTLIGLRADMDFSKNFKLGGTFIFQSEKVKEDRPKIGNENRSLILAGLDGELDYEVPLITRLVDLLPFIKTDAKSSVTLSGEVATSLPNIYGSDKQHDKNEAYVDDMESTVETFPLGITREVWDPASQPTNVSFGKADLNFYNPQNIRAEDIYDPQTLSAKEEREKVQVLACKINPNNLAQPGVDPYYWAGLMKYVGNNTDFTNKKYIEFLVKVDTLNYNSASNPVVMHIDLGKVSEDFYKPGQSTIPDKEDGIITTDGLLDIGEDLGLDRIVNGDIGDDPEDNYSNTKFVINGEEEYPSINGTEGNDKLDSEDLDNNGRLNLDETFFEYSISLNEGDEFLESQYNGWRLFRVPLHDPDNYTVISNETNTTPDMLRISYARIWFQVQDSTRIKLVSLDIVGNKWEEEYIKDQDNRIVLDEEETMKVGTIDNQKDQHYTPAPYTVIKKDGEDTLEQSLIIDYENLGEMHHGLVTQRFRDKIDFTRTVYEKLRLWVYSEQPQPNVTRSDPDSMIVRLGADSLNYYEIKSPLNTVQYYAEMERDDWVQLELPFTDLTALKLLEEENSKSITMDGLVLSKVGNATLSNIREISLGMQATESFTGRIYFDDIRVVNPYEEVGYAARATFDTQFADFATLNVNLEWKTANFISTASRNNSTNYTETLDFNITNNYNLQKFFPAEWGLSLPLKLKRLQHLGIPRYKTNSDLLRSELSSEEQKREQDKTLTYRADLSFSQNKTPRNKILAYTIKNTSITSSIQQQESRSATYADTTVAFNLKHTYKLTLDKEKIDVSLGKNYKFYFFPNYLENSLTYNDSRPKRWTWGTVADSIPEHWRFQENYPRVRTLATNSKITYDIFTDFKTSYQLVTKRDLMMPMYLKDVNIGEEKERTQNISLNYTPQYLDKIFSYNVGFDVTYDEDHKKSGQVDTLYYDGFVNRTIGGSFTIKNKDMLQGLATWIENKFGKKEEDKISDKEDLLEDPVKLDKEIFEQPGELDEKEEETTSQYSNFSSRDDEGKDFSKDPGKDLGKDFGKGDGSQDEIPDGKEVDGEKDIKGTNQSGTNKSNIFAVIVSYLARLDNIKVNYDNTYKTVYDDRIERPNYLYQLGLPHILKDADILSKTNNDKFSTSIGLPILNNLSTTWGFSKDFKRSYGTYNKMTETTVFPNISITLTEFEKLIGADELLTSSRLSSSFTLTSTDNRDIGAKTNNSEGIRMSLAPLLSWYGNWKNNISSNLSFNYTRNTSENLKGVKSETTSNNWSVSGNVSWTYAAAKGIKILFFKRSKLKNELTTDISFMVEGTKEKKLTKVEDKEDESQLMSNTQRFTVSPEISYKFNKSISGGLLSSYELSNNFKKGTSTRIFRLGIFIEIIF